jgi:hypothetical protein
MPTVTACNYSRDLRLTKWGLTINSHCKIPEPPMSALGQKQTSKRVQSMSALPPKADIGTPPRDVHFVPEADIAPLIRSLGRRVQERWLEFVSQVPLRC